MIRLTDLLKENINENWLNQHVAIYFPSVVAKDIKNAFDGINFYVFVSSSNNFSDNNDQPSYKMIGLKSIRVYLVSKSDYESALSKLNSKYQTRLKSFIAYPPEIEDNFRKFLIKNINPNDFKYSSDDLLNHDLYFKIGNDSSNKIAKIWNSLKEKELSKYTVKDAVYHVSANVNLKVGDTIKPYFNSQEYIKSLSPFTMDVGSQAFRIAEFYLEKFRPSTAPSRDKSTFVFKNVGDAIEYLHGGNRSIWAVKPTSKVYWVDMRWVDTLQGQIASIYSDYDDTSKNGEREAKRAADKIGIDISNKYWSGKATSDPIWEGITVANLEVIKRVK